MRLVYPEFSYADNSLSVAFCMKVCLDKMVGSHFFFFLVSQVCSFWFKTSLSMSADNMIFFAS